MDDERIIKTLKAEAAKSNVVRDMLKTLAGRDRDRGALSLRSLYLQMRDAGYKHTPLECAEGLKALSSASIGTTKKNGKGDIVAIENISLSLRSLGLAVAGKSKKLDRFERRNEYTEIGAEADEVRTPPAPSTAHAQLSGGHPTINIQIGNKTVPIAIPSGLTSDELFEFINRLRGSK